MRIQRRILTLVTRANWVLMGITSLAGLIFMSPKFALGVFLGGLIVTVNFHLLARTLKNALTPPHLVSPNVVITKYYLRFVISGILIFLIILSQWVHPLGLIAGLSVVVLSIMLATLVEIKHLLLKEAV